MTMPLSSKLLKIKVAGIIQIFNLILTKNTRIKAFDPTRCLSRQN